MLKTNPISGTRISQLIYCSLVNFVVNLFKILYYKGMIPLLRLYELYELYKLERVVNNERMDSTLDEYDTYVSHPRGHPKWYKPKYMKP